MPTVTTRRGFLGLLAAAVAAGAVPVSLAARTKPLVAPDAERAHAGSPDIRDFQRLAHEALRRLERELAADGPFVFVGGPHRMGDAGLTDQLTRTIRNDATWRPLSDVAKSLADSVRYHRLTRFGTLPALPPGRVDAALTVVSTSSGIALRVLREFDVWSDAVIIRFDLLAG